MKTQNDVSLLGFSILYSLWQIAKVVVVFYLIYLIW